MNLALTEQAAHAGARARPEPSAFATLYDRYYERLYRYLRYRVPEPQTAADLTAEVFERALRHLDRYDPARGAFSTWLFTIARNRLKNYYRWQRLRQWLPLASVAERPDQRPDPAVALVENEQVAALLAAVARLTEREREIIALKFGAGLTNRHIATLTRLSESNVGVILYRTVRKLRAELGDAFDERA